MANLTEGLLPWQPKKLYFMTDAFENWGPHWHDPQTLSPYRKTIVDHTGPVYETSTISPVRHKSYAEITAEQQRSTSRRKVTLESKRSSRGSSPISSTMRI
jgi:hypothetical protein